MNDDNPAYALGYQTGRGAASWVFDGNTARETYERVLRGIEEGDPEIMDAYRLPDLSGEWDDGMTPFALAAELDIDYDSDPEALQDACEAWEAGASDGFWHAVEHAARIQLAD